MQILKQKKKKMHDCVYDCFFFFFLVHVALISVMSEIIFIIFFFIFCTHIKNRSDFSVIKNHFFYYYETNLISYKVKTIFFLLLKNRSEFF